MRWIGGRSLTGLVLVAACFFSCVSQTRAVLVMDPAGDLLNLPGLTRNHTGQSDLDVLMAQVIFTGQKFIFDATYNGLIGTTLNQAGTAPGGRYVWGLNRGGGINAAGVFVPPVQGFPTIAPGVIFDTVIAFAFNTTTNTWAGAIAGSPFDVTVNGNRMIASIDATKIPTRPGGFLSQTDFTFNLWPRDARRTLPNGALEANDLSLADFAPNNSMAQVTVPEPGSLAVFAIGGVLAGLRGWTRRRTS